MLFDFLRVHQYLKAANGLFIRSCLKDEFWSKVKAVARFNPEEYSKYFEDLNRAPNAEIEPKGIFETASTNSFRLCPGLLSPDLASLSSFESGARGETRTPILLPELDPKSSASTNFATLAQVWVIYKIRAETGCPDFKKSFCIGTF